MGAWDLYDWMMFRPSVLLRILAVSAVFPLPAAELPSPAAPPPPPAENRYDVLSKMITPMAAVLLGGSQGANRGLTLRATVDQVAGRLPQILKGATFTAWIE